LAKALSMMVLACFNVSLDMRSSLVSLRNRRAAARRGKRGDYTSGLELLSIVEAVRRAGWLQYAESLLDRLEAGSTELHSHLPS
jgi:hypothetical protein